LLDIVEKIVLKQSGGKADAKIREFIVDAGVV